MEINIEPVSYSDQEATVLVVIVSNLLEVENNERQAEAFCEMCMKITSESEVILYPLASQIVSIRGPASDTWDESYIGDLVTERLGFKRI